MEFKYFPAITSLTAGLIVALVMFFGDTQITTFLLVLFVVLVVFYLIGSIMRFFLLKLLEKFKTPEAEPIEEESETEKVEVKPSE